MNPERDEFYEAALAFAKSKGWDRDELPRGDRGSNRTCPMALACGTTWGRLYMNVPNEIYAFVIRFDQGQYPDLIADEDDL